MLTTSGSYAHGVSGNPATIYGFGTWTNGPVAVSYLSTYLGIPLATDYAYGHANGGSLFGATIDNTYTNSTAGAPDAIHQIKNYTSNASTKAKINSTLHFLWIGANDINLYHINVDSSTNPSFASAMASRMKSLVQTLVDDGAKYIVVPNLYPKQISPSSEFYANTATRITNLGLAIDQANSAIKTSLATFGSKVVYVDVNAYMKYVWSNHTTYGITHVGGEFCDGYSQADWNLCVVQKHGNTFYWMQYLDMTTYVHSWIANYMFAAIRGHTF